MTRRLLLSALYCMLLLPNAAAEEAIPFLRDIPAGCGNEDVIFRRPPYAFPAGPTWVERCDNACSAGVPGGAIWHPHSICRGTLIVRVRCRLDPSRGCAVPEMDSSDATNIDCAQNSGGATECVNREVPVTCRFDASGKHEGFRASSTAAFCSRPKAPISGR